MRIDDTKNNQFKTLCEVAREVNKIKTRSSFYGESVKANQVSDLWARHKNQNSAHWPKWEGQHSLKTICLKRSQSDNPVIKLSLRGSRMLKTLIASSLEQFSVCVEQWAHCTKYEAQTNQEGMAYIFWSIIKSAFIWAMPYKSTWVLVMT